MQAYKWRLSKTACLWALITFVLQHMLVFNDSNANDSGNVSKNNQLNVLVNDIDEYQKYYGSTMIRPFENMFDVDINLIEFQDNNSKQLSGLGKHSLVIDVVDLSREKMIYACEQGWLTKIDWFFNESSADFDEKINAHNVGLDHQFLDTAVLECGIGHAVSAIVYGYDRNTFATNEPLTIADFFNVDDFPGQRLIKDDLVAILEWTLLSHNVPKAQVYSLLSTDRGLDLAFKKLDSIRDSIVWWHNEKEVFQLLKSKEPMFVLAPNEVLFEAEMAYGLPVNVVWESNLSDMNVLALPKHNHTDGTEKVRLAKHYIRFFSHAKQQARLANTWPFSPTNTSALPLITNHQQHQVPMMEYLPSNFKHLEDSLVKDSIWYRRANKLIQKRFKAWLDNE